METTDQKNDRKRDTILEKSGRVPAESADQRRGLIPSVIGLGVDVTEDALTGAIGLVDDVRRESRQALVATIDFAESLSKAVLGLGRRTVERVDRIAVDVLTGSERVTVATLGGLRSLTNNASALADQAARSIVGARNDGSVASA